MYEPFILHVVFFSFQVTNAIGISGDQVAVKRYDATRTVPLDQPCFFSGFWLHPWSWTQDSRFQHHVWQHKHPDYGYTTDLTDLTSLTCWLVPHTKSHKHYWSHTYLFSIWTTSPSTSTLTFFTLLITQTFSAPWLCQPSPHPWPTVSWTPLIMQNLVYTPDHQTLSTPLITKPCLHPWSQNLVYTPDHKTLSTPLITKPCLHPWSLNLVYTPDHWTFSGPLITGKCPWTLVMNRWTHRTEPVGYRHKFTQTHTNTPAAAFTEKYKQDTPTQTHIDHPGTHSHSHKDTQSHTSNTQKISICPQHTERKA